MSVTVAAEVLQSFAVLQLEPAPRNAGVSDAPDRRYRRTVNGFVDWVEAELFGLENYRYFEVVTESRRAGPSEQSILPRRPPRPSRDPIAASSQDPARELGRRLSVARTLRVRRLEAGLEPEELAAACGVDPVLYAEIESARRLPNQQELQSLCRVLDLRAADLVDDASAPGAES